MTGIIDDETMENVCILAKLSLSEEEKEKAKQDMQKILDYVEKLDELDTEGVEPLSHIFGDQNVFREDVVTNKDAREAMLANAPKAKRRTVSGAEDHRIGDREMDLGTMTALELAEKIKQHQISVLDGVKYVFDQIEKKEGNVHAYLDTYKKKHTPGQNRWKRGLPPAFTEVRLRAYQSQ